MLGELHLMSSFPSSRGDSFSYSFPFSIKLCCRVPGSVCLYSESYGVFGPPGPGLGEEDTNRSLPYPPTPVAAGLYTALEGFAVAVTSTFGSGILLREYFEFERV